jgi:hypothetical protein
MTLEKKIKYYLHLKPSLLLSLFNCGSFSQVIEMFCEIQSMRILNEKSFFKKISEVVFAIRFC